MQGLLIRKLTEIIRELIPEIIEPIKEVLREGSCTASCCGCRSAFTTKVGSREDIRETKERIKEVEDSHEILKKNIQRGLSTLSTHIDDVLTDHVNPESTDYPTNYVNLELPDYLPDDAYPESTDYPTDDVNPELSDYQKDDVNSEPPNYPKYDLNPEPPNYTKDEDVLEPDSVRSNCHRHYREIVDPMVLKLRNEKLFRDSGCFEEKDTDYETDEEPAEESEPESESELDDESRKCVRSDTFEEKPLVKDGGEIYIGDLKHSDKQKLGRSFDAERNERYIWQYVLEDMTAKKLIQLKSIEIEICRSPTCRRLGSSIFSLLSTRKPKLTVDEFCEVAKKQKRNDICSLLEPCQGNILKDIPPTFKTQLENTCCLPSYSRGEGCWKILVEHFGFEETDIDEIESQSKFDVCNRIPCEEMFDLIKMRSPKVTLQQIRDILRDLNYNESADLVDEVIKDKEVENQYKTRVTMRAMLMDHDTERLDINYVF